MTDKTVHAQLLLISIQLLAITVVLVAILWRL
jgi:hypothetical protein